MSSDPSNPAHHVNVRGTQLLPGDSRERYREKIARITLDSMVQFVGLLDAQGTVLEINHVALDAVGIRLSDVEGKPFWTTFWWQVSEEINAGLRDAIRRAAQGEFVRWDTPIYGRAGGKETIIIDASLMPVKDEHGKVVFITAEGRDITEKKAQEREIAQKNVELEGLLQRIRELDEIKTQFFANVSHELRTPLQLIIGPADRLSKNDAAMRPEQRQESAHVIARNARMLLKHVNDLLDISKFEAGKLKIDLRDTDVAALVRLTASHFEVLAADRKIRFSVGAQVDAICAVDSEKVQRVVMNLLSNAFKFVPDDGSVRVTLTASKKNLVIAVDDSGPGIKPELRKAIFERFRQGDGGANRKFGGTGLGLAIAKEFVEMHQGALEVSDSDLGGARFQLTIPFHRMSASPGTPLPSVQALDQVVVEGTIEELRPLRLGADLPSPLVAVARPTILVVEDNPEMNRFIVESLSAEYTVVAAFDGQQGLERALEISPALIVTDIMMPRVSGDEMIAEIRKRPELTDIPIVLLTAKADEELKTRLLENGAQDFIAKPFSERDLLVRVRNLIELKKTQESHRTLFSSMDQGFCIVEVIFDANRHPLDYRFLEINGAFEKQAGLKSARGRSMRDLAPNHEQHWFDTYGRIALTGEPARFENRAEALGRWFEVYAFRIGPAANRQVAIFFTDITERKRTEAALRASEAAARAASRAKDEFLAALSHELRTPLNPVLLIAGEGAADESLPEPIRDDFRMIAENVTLEARLIDDLLDINRIARGKVTLAREPLALHAVIHDAIATIQEEITAKQIRLTFSLDASAHRVQGDPVRLRQVFWNVLKNAVKFTSQGGTVHVASSNPADGATIEVSVHDSGIGMSPDELTRIFVPFVQGRHADGAGNGHFGGLGLGLAISRSLVDGHDGKIWAESKGANQGTTITIQLPVI